MTTETALRRLGQSYGTVRGRILELVSDLDGTRMIPVPACPSWSVHNLLSHLTGNCADLMNGNLDGLASDDWTARQVAERADRSTASVLEEWSELAPSYAALIDDFPGHYGTMAIGDITTHEQDLRGALGEPGMRDSAEVARTTDFLVRLILHPGAIASGIGPLEIRAGDRRWVVGTGEPATDAQAAWRDALLAEYVEPEERPVASVTAPPFELYRASSGRRSARQIRGFDWSTDPEPFIPIFGSGPFSIATDDLDE